MHLCFPVARGSATFSGQPSDILALLAHRQPSESSTLLMRGQPREISVLLPLFVRPLIRQPFKAVFEWPSRRFWQTLQSANSPWGLPLWQRRPPYPIGFGPWPRPWRVKPKPTVGRIYRGPLSFNCFLPPWGQLLKRCPPLPQPQHTEVYLPTAVVSDLAGCSTVDCRQRRLILASSS